jgi:hypothetical protein
MEWPVLCQYFDTSLFIYYRPHYTTSTIDNDTDLYLLKSVVFNESHWRQFKIIRDEVVTPRNFIPTYRFASTNGIGCLDTESHLDYTYLQSRLSVPVDQIEKYWRPWDHKTRIVLKPIRPPFYAGQFGLIQVNRPAFPLSNLAGHSIGYRIMSYITATQS